MARKGEKMIKLLIISHNIIDESNNVGKTVISFIKPNSCIKPASLYLRNEIRQTALCDSSFMIHDKEIVKSFLSKKRRIGTIIDKDRITSDVFSDRSAYRFGNKRIPLISLIRDFLWHKKVQKCSLLTEWLKSVNPDLILFIPNDYCLAFEIANHVKKTLSVPMITFFTDDAFYFGQKLSPVDWVRRKSLRKIGRETVLLSDKVITASELMRNEYEKVFSKGSIVLGNCIDISGAKEISRANEKQVLVFSYIGNLHSNRWKSLCEIGKALKELAFSERKTIELRVFSSSDISSKILDSFKKSGIVFAGSVPPEQVREKQEESDVLIHVEAFDRKSVKSTRLSMSTKIFEYMARKRPIFAYGPNNVSSIRFLKENSFGIVSDNKLSLKSELKKMIDGTYDTRSIADAAFDYAKNHFERTVVSNAFLQMVQETIGADRRE